MRAWVISGDNLRGDIRIWMDGRPHPSPNALHLGGGFATGKWEGDTLTARITHLKTAWIRRGVGIPGSDDSTITMHLTRRDDSADAHDDPGRSALPDGTARGQPRLGMESARGTDGDRPPVQHRQRDPVPRGHRHRAAPDSRQEPGRGLHGPHVQHAEGSGDGLRAHALSRVPQDDQRHVHARPPTCSERAPGYCCGWIERRVGPAGRPASRATTAASAHSARAGASRENR